MNREPEFIEVPYQRVPVKIGDVIVVSYDGHLSQEQREMIRADLQRTFQFNRVVVLTDGMKLGVASQSLADGRTATPIDPGACRPGQNDG